MNQHELFQAHAVIYALKMRHNPEQELTPWYWYNGICGIFGVQEYLRNFDVTRLSRLPRFSLKTTNYKIAISTDYQLLKFTQAAEFMLLFVSEEQYEFIISRVFEHGSREENISSKEHELFIKSDSPFLSETVAVG